MSNKSYPPTSVGYLMNGYGNVDVRYSLPAGFVWINDPHAAAKANALKIAYAPAFVGFDHVHGHYVPMLQGIVVKTEDEIRLRGAGETR